MAPALLGAVANRPGSNRQRDRPRLATAAGPHPADPGGRHGTGPLAPHRVRYPLRPSVRVLLALGEGMRKKKQDTQEAGFTTPATRPRLTPIDVQQKEFRLAFRGYNERDVDEGSRVRIQPAGNKPAPASPQPRAEDAQTEPAPGRHRSVRELFWGEE